MDLTVEYFIKKLSNYNGRASIMQPGMFGFCCCFVPPYPAEKDRTDGGLEEGGGRQGGVVFVWM